jgi:hypothetical protein
MFKKIIVRGIALALLGMFLLQAPIKGNIAWADPPPPPECDDCE